MKANKMPFWDVFEDFRTAKGGLYGVETTDYGFESPLRHQAFRKEKGSFFIGKVCLPLPRLRIFNRQHGQKL
jgi:hypothetical protein